MTSRSLLSLICFLAYIPTTHAASQPNVIFIFIDDMGWTDLGCYGNTFVDTPRIDQLAAEGMRFTNAYASGSVCSPTRAAVQSGQSPVRTGVTDFIPGHWRPFERVITPMTKRGLPLDTVTIGEALQSAGYATGYIGKWHLAMDPQFGPEHQGYEFVAEIGGPHLPGKYDVINRDDLKPGANQYRSDFEADISIDFIKSNRDRPFFLFLSPYVVHIPLGAMSEKAEKYRKRAEATGRDLPHPVYAAMIEHCDDMVGRIVDAVEEAGLSENTMIVFTSDNGGLYRRYDYRAHADDLVSDLSPLRGEKGSLHEGGVRIPFIVKYPPLVQPGTISEEPVISHDTYPTFVELADGALPDCQTIEGLSLLPVFADASAKLNRDALYWHYPHYHHDRPASSIRTRDWKLIEYLDNTGELQLFNLAEDIDESENLAAEQPEKAAQLQAGLQAWRTSVIAPMPTPNPAHDPSRAHEWWQYLDGNPVDSDGRKRFPPTERDE